MSNLKGLLEFPTILIVIGMLLLFAAVIVGIFAFRKPKIDKIDIEKKLDSVSLEDNLEKIKEFTEEKKKEQEIEQIEGPLTIESNEEKNVETL